MTTWRTIVSVYFIKISLGVGGSLLSAIFFLEGALRGGFLAIAAMVFYLLIMLIVRRFSKVNLILFSFATLVWTVVLYSFLLRSFGT
jgi:hypothetical protein